MANESQTRFTVNLKYDDSSPLEGDNALSVQCDLPQVFHDTITKDGQFTTLAVFQFALIPQGNGRRFLEADISIGFSNVYIMDMTQYGNWLIVQSTEERELSHNISQALAASLSTGKTTKGYEWGLDDEITKRGSKLSGAMDLDQLGLGAKRKTVSWKFYEDDGTNSSIPNFVQTAVLLHRRKAQDEPPGRNFILARVNIRCKVLERKWTDGKWVSSTINMTGRRILAERMFSQQKVTFHVESLRNVRLEDFQYMATIPTFERGNETTSERIQASTKEVNPADYEPRRIHEKAATVPATRSTGSLIQLLRRAVASETSKESDKLQMNTQTFQPTDSHVGPEKGQIVSLSDDKKKQRVDYLEKKLSLIEKEATLVTRLMGLVKKERAVLEEINVLKD